MKIRELIKKYNMTLMSDGNVRTSKKPDNIDEIKKLKPQIVEELKKIEQKEKKQGDPRFGKLSLSYYNGDWYRANAIFKTEEFGGNQPEWGNNENIFSDAELNKITASFWNEKEKKGYVSAERIVAKLEKLFACTLSTKKEELEKRFPDLAIEMRTYDNMSQGKGEYVSEIIFPDFQVFEKYVRIIFSENIKKNKQYEKKVQLLFDTAKKTGTQQLIESYPDTCNDTNESCDIDIVSIYAMPDGSKKVERNHTW